MTTPLVGHALERIEAGGLDTQTEAALAASLGVSSRHLRRRMSERLGLSPVELAQARRLSLARQLLEGSSLSITDVAFASGFRSLRRFNVLFARAYGKAPSQLRRRPGGREARETVQLRLAYRDADWPSTLERLAARAIPGVEAVSDGVYCRTARFGDAEGWFALSPGRRRGTLSAEVALSLARSLSALVPAIESLLETGVFDSLEERLRQALTPLALHRLVEICGPPFEHPYAPLSLLFPCAREIAASAGKRGEKP